jgi:hypothetical protein
MRNEEISTVELLKHAAGMLLKARAEQEWLVDEPTLQMILERVEDEDALAGMQAQPF